jgi:hypothetical protein
MRTGNDINWGTLDGSGHIGIYVGDSGGVYRTNADATIDLNAFALIQFRGLL